MSDLIFLPDREGRDELGQANGFVRVGGPDDALQTLAERLILPDRKGARGDRTMWRGVLAFALLCDAWSETRARITLQKIDTEKSLFAAWLLAARPDMQKREAVHLVLLELDGRQELLGVSDPHAGLMLPATPADYTGLVPARAAWYHKKNGTWSDPLPYLNEHERAILYARLEMMSLNAPEVLELKRDLNEAEQENIRRVRQGDEAALAEWSLQMQAVCAMRDFEAFSERKAPVRVTKDNPLVRICSDVDVRYPETALQTSTYLWKGVPFARTSSALGLTGVIHPKREDALQNIRQELALMTAQSTRFARRAADGISEWLRTCDAALLPEIRLCAEDLRSELNQKSLEYQEAVELTWPWDASSGAVRMLLKEALGDGWLDAAGHPFAEKLTRLNGVLLSDPALRSCCAAAEGVYLPPLSRELARCNAHSGDGEGLAVDALRFESAEDGSVTVSMLLRGLGEVRMMRTYTPEEQITLEEEECPCIALWPGQPIPGWRGYQLFVRGLQVEALRENQWVAAEASASPWQCLQTDTYPEVLLLSQGDTCLGALPNQQTSPAILPVGEAVAAIDLGSAWTKTALTVGGIPAAEGEEMLPLLPVMPAHMQPDELLISLIPDERISSAVRLYGPGDALFADGYVYPISEAVQVNALAPGEVQTALKWRADGTALRARKILLRHTMRQTAMRAAMQGASSLTWRIGVPDEMVEEGREALLAMVEEVARETEALSGISLSNPAVLWAEEATALHEYLRVYGNQRGAVVAVNMGAATTKMHLWLPGRTRPTAGAVLMDGTQNLLIDAMKDLPVLLEADFADCHNPQLAQDVSLLCAHLAKAGEGRDAFDQARLLLEAMLENHKAEIVRHLEDRAHRNHPTYTQAILMELLCGVSFAVGVMLDQAGLDSNISHLFPSDVPVHFTGKGAWVLEMLSSPQRLSLENLIRSTMAIRHPVQTVSVGQPGRASMATALGLATLRQSVLPNDPPLVRSRRSFTELMRALVEQMLARFPAFTWVLHPEMFDQTGRLTQEAGDTIRRLASLVYGDGEDIPASIMAFLREMRAYSREQNAR